MNHTISKSVKKVDVEKKCSGEALYIDDISMPDMLYAGTLRSTKAKAIIKKITLPILPEGYLIVDEKDIPGETYVKMLKTDWPYFASGQVNYIGEPMLLIVGPDKQKIKELILATEVEYQDLEPIFSIDDNGECIIDFSLNKGNFEETFSLMKKEKFTTLTETFSTGYQEHVYLEPQGMIGAFENNTISVYGSIQCPYYVKNALIQAFGWLEEKIRVVQTVTGGGFGGKEEYPSLIAGHVAFAAYKTGKPVKLVFSRSEDIEVTTKRHPSRTQIKSYLSPEGKVMAMDIDVRLDAGAYAGLTEVVLQRSLFASIGVYDIPLVRIRGRAFRTNTVPTGAFRGFGAPQTFFAIEMHMSHLAKKIGENPVEFKKKHFVCKGSKSVTSGTFTDDIKLTEMYEKIVKMQKDNGKSPSSAGYSFIFHGCGFTGSGERDIIKAKVRLEKKGNTVRILIAHVDIGQGTETAMTKIVLHVLTPGFVEKNRIKILVERPDTALVPDSGPTVASRTVVITGKLVERAAEEMKKRWDEKDAFLVEKNYIHPAGKKWNQETFSGDAYPTYSWGINSTEVYVDPDTFEIKVNDFFTVFDLGTPIDLKMTEGQIHGGVIQGIGYATIEFMEQREGKIQQDSLSNYTIPTSLDIPRIHHALVDNPFDGGPFGAKCAGELTFIGAAPAIADAVEKALGINVYQIPLTPEYLQNLVQVKQKRRKK
jgi:CO/xanthine dehydrogenase Mo-binding subunit